MRHSVHARPAALSIHPVSDVCRAGRARQAGRPALGGDCLTRHWVAETPGLNCLVRRPSAPFADCSTSRGRSRPEALALSVIGDASSYGLSKSFSGRQGPLEGAASILVLAPFGSARWTYPTMPPGNQCSRVAPQSWGRAAGPMTASPTTAACANSVSMANPHCAEPRRPTRLRRLPVQGRSARPVLG
jgi:hypothetical protein